MKRPDLENLHFRGSSKARYRTTLTIGVMAATACSFVGTIYGMPYLLHVGTVVNSITAAIWIWE